MNLSQAKIQLEKIIALYKSMSADEKNISAIERDLMLSYIRGLYENFLDTTTPSQTASSPSSNDTRPTVTPKPVVVETPPPPVVEQPKPTPPPVFEQPKYVPPVVEQPKYVPPPVVEKPRIETPPPPPVVVELPKPVPPPPPEPIRYKEPAHEAIRYQTPSPAPSNRDTSRVSSNVSPDIQALFEETAGNELSDRLANTPINDLTKAFGLNDRLLMQNELFGNNKAVFDEILKDLNNASSFDSAQGYLVDFAKRYNWTVNTERQRHAKAFIKVVRRRFK